MLFLSADQCDRLYLNCGLATLYVHAYKTEASILVKTSASRKRILNPDWITAASPCSMRYWICACSLYRHILPRKQLYLLRSIFIIGEDGISPIDNAWDSKQSHKTTSDPDVPLSTHHHFKDMFVLDRTDWPSKKYSLRTIRNCID